MSMVSKAYIAHYWKRLDLRFYNVHVYTACFIYPCKRHANKNFTNVFISKFFRENKIVGTTDNNVQREFRECKIYFIQSWIAYSVVNSETSNEIKLKGL